MRRLFCTTRFGIIALALLATPMADAEAQSMAVVSPPPSSQSAPLDQAISEASRRFGVPETWIRAVIRFESFGDPRAVSRKGAIGLMQLMPATYATLRQSLHLGANPFDIHDNVAAGTAYMRMMFDRYGVAGMVGAYNAGPARWEAYVSGVRSLPSETVSYLARLADRLGFVPPAVASKTSSPAGPTPREAPLFVSLSRDSTASQGDDERLRVVATLAANPSIVRTSSNSDGRYDGTPADRPNMGVSASTMPTASTSEDSRGSLLSPADSLFAPAVRRSSPR